MAPTLSQKDPFSGPGRVSPGVAVAAGAALGLVLCCAGNLMTGSMAPVGVLVVFLLAFYLFPVAVRWCESRELPWERARVFGVVGLLIGFMISGTVIQVFPYLRDGDWTLASVTIASQIGVGLIFSWMCYRGLRLRS